MIGKSLFKGGLVFFFSLVAVGCGGGGEGGGGGGSSTFSLTSSDFSSGGAIPTVSACPKLGGRDQLPNFAWSGAPSDTRSFGLTVIDLNAQGGVSGAGGYVHAVAYNIPATAVSTDDAAFDDGTAIFALNDSSVAGYSGPCPPDGTTHTYQATIYALDVADLSTMELLTDTASVIAAIRGNDIASATLSGTFTAP